MGLCQRCGTPRTRGEKFCSQACYRHASPRDRFNSYLGIPTMDFCIPWIGTTRRNGYGYFKVKGKKVAAHRYAWEQAEGSPISPGVEVLHVCDNPSCVNLNHLYLGNDATNVNDRQERQRQARGTDVHTAKLTDAVVIEIRRRYRPGEISQSKLASEYGIHNSTVSDIVHRRIWKHVP